MRSLVVALLAVGCSPLLGVEALRAGERKPQTVEYLYRGDLARGEQVLQTALEQSPQDAELRLGFGLLQVVRAVERLGQSLYHYGLKSGESNESFLRIPIPRNPDPVPVTYKDLERVTQQFRSDLSVAEATLAGINDDDVQLRVKLAAIMLDLNGDRTPESSLGDIVRKLMGPRFRFPEKNPDLLVCIDRGDVAWLRAYCHLLMGIVEMQSALDLEQQFDLTTSAVFENPKVKYRRKDPDDWRELTDVWKRTVIKEPARMGRFRKHMLAVCELNHETWRYIRSETDDDFEWLPNPRQTGVLGLPVSDQMINAWLAMIDEFKGFLNGTRRISPELVAFVSPKSVEKKGFSLRNFLTDPPDAIDHDKLQNEGIDPKYLVSDVKDLDIAVLFRVGAVFQNSMAVGYAAWFN